MSKLNGEGTRIEPYKISKVEELTYMAQQVSSGEVDGYKGKYFVLTENIDCRRFKWEPIGIYGALKENNIPFKGHFDGLGKTVSNLRIDVNLEDWYGNLSFGFFGSVNGGHIVNLNMSDVRITVESSHDNAPGLFGTGALVGISRGCRIENCHVKSGRITIAFAYEGVGGLIGCGSGIVRDCSVNVSVSSISSHVGGLIGNGGVEIENCEVKGDVVGKSYVGGIVGQGGDSVVKSCIARCNVKGVSCVGGLIGDSGGGRVENCMSTGNVETHGDQTEDYAIGTGGLVGFMDRGSISRCIATGNVSGDGIYVGGLVGRVGNGHDSGVKIENCMACGNTVGVIFIGGLVGWSEYDSDIETSISLGEVTKDSKSKYRAYIGGIIGKQRHGPVKNCIACGEVPSICSKGLDEQISVADSFFIGKPEKQPDGNFFSKLFGYQEKSQPTYDNGEPKTAEELTNGKNPGFTNPEAWVFLNGSYPCPKALAENPVADIKSVAVNSVKR